MTLAVLPSMRIDGKRVLPRLELTLNLVAAFPLGVADTLRRVEHWEGKPSTPHGELHEDRQAHGGRRSAGALQPAHGEAGPRSTVMQQALAEGGPPQDRRPPSEGFVTSGLRRNVR